MTDKTNPVTQYKLVAAKKESLKRVWKIGERVQKAQRYKLEKRIGQGD